MFEEHALFGNTSELTFIRSRLIKFKCYVSSDKFGVLLFCMIPRNYIFFSHKTFYSLIEKMGIVPKRAGLWMLT